MKRVVIVVIVLALALTVGIGLKLRAQDEAQRGPPSGSAVIEGEGADLSARLGARVTRVLVEEGARVEAGATVIELDCREPEARLAEAEARLASARAQATGAVAQAEAARRQSLAARASVGAAGAGAVALDTQRDAAGREAERLEAMGEHAALARRDQARSAASGLEAQARAARSQRTASQRQASAASSQAEAAVAQSEAVSLSVGALEAMVETARLMVGECRILAPRAGSIERVHYEVGELVMPGAVVARVVDPSFVRATFYLANADLDAASVGGRARVEADTYAGRRFAGVIRRIGLEAEFTPRNIQTRSDRDRLVYPIEVRVPNPDGALRPGMPVTVTLAEGDAS